MSNSDPFGVEKKFGFGGKGSALRIPKAASKGEQYARKAKRGAKTKFQNATSRNATVMSRGKEPVDEHGRVTGRKYSEGGKVGAYATGQKFGQRTSGQNAERDAGKHMSRRVGYIAGTVGGTAAGIGIHSQQAGRDKKVLYEVQKARAFKITNLGTKASGAGRPGFRPGSVAAGAVVGAALPYSVSSWERKDARNALDTKYKRQEQKKKKASLVAKAKKPEIERYTPSRKERAKMRGERGAQAGAAAGAGVLALKTVQRQQLTPAYRKLRPYKAKPALVAAGVGAALGASGKLDKDQYRVKKRGTIVAKQESSAGRTATAGAFGGWHGAVAGKKGKKLRAFGNQAVGGAAGGLAGGALGSALTRGKTGGAAAGQIAGTVGGSIAGLKRNEKKGYLKPVKKNNTLSAFGVEHGY